MRSRHMVGQQMDKENRVILLIAVLIFILVCVFTSVCKADDNDAYYATMISFFVRQIGDLRLALADMRGELTDTRVELAEMRGEVRGRQNATTGVAAGVPTILAGLVAIWLRRKAKSKKE